MKLMQLIINIRISNSTAKLLFFHLTFVHYCNITSLYQGADKSLARSGRKQVRKYVRDARYFNKIETQAVINILFLQGKLPKEIHAF